jgi:hypothetical protein
MEKTIRIPNFQLMSWDWIKPIQKTETCVLYKIEKLMPKHALYAYFGELGIFPDDIPGHSIYQLGLINALAETYELNSFDFYNYLDVDKGSSLPIYPEGLLGNVFQEFHDHYIAEYRPSFQTVLDNISSKSYSKLFLKARFRNLATITKKLKDAVRFEQLLSHALNVGYDPKDIIILDTDLSLSEEFKLHITNLGIQIVIPSISIPGIGQGFLKSCMAIHEKIAEAEGITEKSIIYYGNLSFDNYKKGHEKNEIVFEIIDQINHQRMFNGTHFAGYIAAKETPQLRVLIDNMEHVQLIPRTDRLAIWNQMKRSLVSLNVSKDLYLENDFIPARVYESVILGVIPVSYMKSAYKALSFDSVEDFFEICKFLAECSPADYYKILMSVANTF